MNSKFEQDLFDALLDCKDYDTWEKILIISEANNVRFDRKTILKFLREKEMRKVSHLPLVEKPEMKDTVSYYHELLDKYTNAITVDAVAVLHKIPSLRYKHLHSLVVNLRNQIDYLKKSIEDDCLIVSVVENHPTRCDELRGMQECISSITPISFYHG